MPTCSEPNPLRRDGLSQSQRRLPALDPASAPLDDRDADQLLAFAVAYAQKTGLRFFFPDSDLQADGTPAAGLPLPDARDVWPRLLGAAALAKPTDDYQAPTVADLAGRADNPPQLALFLAFLKLFGLVQEQLNSFTQRHLDFYYREVLQLQARPAVADQVHLTFELARNVAEQLLPAGTTFDAGLDATERPLLYQAAAARVLSRAGLAQVRAVYVPPTAGPVLFAPNAATADGVAAALPADDLSWNAFGPVPDPAALPADGWPTAPAWPTAQVGFALAAPLLLLAEGQRRITVLLTTTAALPARLPTGLRVQLSGATAWIEAGPAVALVRLSDYQCRLDVTLPADDKRAVVGYSAARLEGGYATTAPVLRVLLPTAGDYQALRGLTLRSVQLEVGVSNLQKSLVLDNDLGKLNPEKPFLPFGPAPVKGARLYVDCPEAAAKPLSALRVRIPGWLGKPDGWAGYYAGYDAGQQDPSAPVEVTVRGNALATPRTVELFEPTSGSDDTKDGSRVLTLTGATGLWLSATEADEPEAELDDTRFLVFERSQEQKFDVKTLLGSRFAGLDGQKTAARESYAAYEVVGQDFKLVSPLDSRPDDTTPPPVPAVNERLLTLRLQRDFGHRDYPRLLTEAAYGARTTTTLTPAVPATTSPAAPAVPAREVTVVTPPTIPNAPYAPLAEGLLLDYEASTGPVLVNAPGAAFGQRPVQLLHHGPFGTAEEHVQLKQSLAFLPAADRATAFLLPQLATGGTFLLGLREARPLETVSVLFQLAEGSANPAREPARVVWSVLSQNQWCELTGPHTPVDATDHLLTSGIIDFYLPAETRTDNTLLAPGLVWLKGELQLLPAAGSTGPAALPAPPDSVARLVALHPQAVRARFVDYGNAPAHYDAPLPAATIARLRQGLPGVKAVRQPYPSFGGQPAETDAAFYTRVSERLRHKRRAVTIWDYEHLVLARFPNLYLAQCLNHTRVDEAGRLHELAPGCVTLVLVPDLRHAYAASPLAPLVDTRTLAAVRAFVQGLAGPQVQVQAVSPVYEPVQVSAKVAFRPGFPAGTYQGQLGQDLRAYLSPWAYDRGARLTLGGSISKSGVLAFIEQLPYVDFVTELSLRPATGGSVQDPDTVQASSARAVLASAATHVFTPILLPLS